MAAAGATPSPRRAELLDAAYRYVLAHGIAELSLRPLAAAIGSSPRVLLFLFGSKDGLVRALLERARAEQLALLPSTGTGLDTAGRRVWTWLAEPARRPLLTLWLQCYARSLTDPGGPWDGFATGTVEDWLTVLAAAQPPDERDAPAAAAARTAVLALLRGALIDLLATGDLDRTTAAVHRGLDRGA